jgi:hypothetical protein
LRGDFEMPTSQPVRASGSHEIQRPRPIPAKVKEACLAMIYGPADAGDNAVPVDFIEAAKLCDIRPNILRKWLHKPAVVQFIRRERAAFRVAICAANEFALRRVRDTSENGMAVIGAVRGLEDLDVAEVQHSRGTQQTPGIVIVISPPNTAPEPMSATIEHTPHVDAKPGRADDARSSCRRPSQPRKYDQQTARDFAICAPS